MTPQISFFVPGIPKGQPRPRAFFNKHTGRASVFDAGTAEAWKASIAVEAVKHKPTAPISGAVKLRLVFNIARPKGHYSTKANVRSVRPSSPFYHTGKPDADNLAKAVMDCMTQLGWFWGDDAQVSTLVVVKRYADTTSGALIEVGEVAP